MNGELAVNQSLAQKFNLILMDLEMPVKDGFQSTMEIRNNKNNFNYSTPIIALTANATNLAQSKCSEVGMNLYLTKPLNPLDLMFSIAGLEPFQYYRFNILPMFYYIILRNN